MSKSTCTNSNVDAFAFTSFAWITSIASRVAVSIIYPCRNHGRPNEIHYGLLSMRAMPNAVTGIPNLIVLRILIYFGGPGGSRTRVQNPFLSTSYSLNCWYNFSRDRLYHQRFESLSILSILSAFVQ